MADIFICYARKDTDRVSHWVNGLQQRGFSVWMDVTNVDGAAVWAKEIVDAIDTCRVVALMLSHHSAGSHHVVKELSLATDKAKRILPLKLEAVNIPAELQYHLASIQFLELYGREEGEIFDAIARALSHHGVVPQEGAEAPAAGQPTAPATGEGPMAAAKRIANQIGAKCAETAREAGPKIKPTVVRATNTKWKKALAGALGVVLLVLILWGIWGDSGGETVGGRGAVGGTVVSTGLPESTFGVAVQSVNIRWVVKGVPGLGDKAKSFVGTAGVVSDANGKLLLVTNSSSIGLRKMGVVLPAIKSFDMSVTFLHGTTKQVQRFADDVDDLNMAVFEVNSEGLTAGKDYVVLPFKPKLVLSPRDEVLVLKRSDDARSTDIIRATERVQMMGSRNTDSGICQTIHLDGMASAASRGGMLFREDGGEYFWVGVNLFGTKDTEENENVAIYAGEILEAKPAWVPCTPAGAVRALKSAHNIRATLAD